MKTRLVVACTALLVFGVAWAQPRNAPWLGFPGGDPASLGRGGTVIAPRSDAFTWSHNPAGLGLLPHWNDSTWGFLTPEERERREAAEQAHEFNYQVGAYWLRDSVGLGDATNTIGLSLSGYNVQHGYGWGVGLGRVLDDANGGGLGFGQRFGHSNFAWGFDGVLCDPDDYDNEVYFSGGLMYSDPHLRIGLLAGDLGNATEDGPVVSVGGSYIMFDGKLLLTADALDVGTQVFDDPLVNFGVEYDVGAGLHPLRLRAGAVDTGDDHNWTFGAGYNFGTWEANIGFENADGGDVISVGATTYFPVM